MDLALPTAQLKFPNNAPVPAAITLVQGNRLRLKLEAIPKAYLLSTRTDVPSVLSPLEINHNARADSWQFNYAAMQPGLAKLFVFASQGTNLNVSPGVIAVTVVSPLVLPADNTSEGMLARLFLAENPSPASTGASWKIEEIKTAMQWMRRVVENRLKGGQPEEFMARGATTVLDIVKADDKGSVQFHGFNLYPVLEPGVARNINQYLEIANNGLHPLRKSYADFVQAAIDIAQAPVPADPTTTGLFGWRTNGATSPGAEFKVHAALAGNTFYTHARLRKHD